jgi:hypothetical protein
MAQEVQSVVPDAVMRGRDGYMRVDYDRLGLPFQTWEQWFRRADTFRQLPALETKAHLSVDQGNKRYQFLIPLLESPTEVAQDGFLFVMPKSSRSKSEARLLTTWQIPTIPRRPTKVLPVLRPA